MTIQNLRTINPAQLIPIPDVPASYGLRNAEDREVYRLVRKALDSEQWNMPIRDWKAALNRFAIQFEDRVPQA